MFQFFRGVKNGVVNLDANLDLLFNDPNNDGRINILRTDRDAAGSTRDPDAYGGARSHAPDPGDGQRLGSV